MISKALRPKFGSSSRKEDNTVAAPIDRPILMLKASVRSQ